MTTAHTPDAHLGLSLSELDTLWGHLGAIGIGYTAYELCSLRKRARQLDTAKKSLREQLFKIAQSNRSELRVGGKVVFVSPPLPPTTRWRVSSEDVKKHNPVLWESSKTFFPYCKADGPVKTLAYRGGRPVSVGAILAELDKINAEINEIKYGAVPVHVERMNEIVTLVDGWNGDLVLTNDGWKLQTRQFKFSETRLQEIDPDTYDSLLREHPVKGRVATLVIKNDDGSEFTDEEDGE